MITTGLCQNIRFDEISKEDGLSSNEATCVYQDHRGFIWIGTVDGLNCYDGEKFTHYRNQHDNPYTISNNRIGDIKECADSNLWISTRNGLNRYLFEYDRFQRYYHDSVDKTTISDNILRYFFLDNTNSFWLTSKTGLNRFIKSKDNTYSFKRYYPERIIDDGPKRIEYSLFEMVQDEQGYLWIGSWAGGLIKFDIQNERFYHYRHDDNDPLSVSSNNVLTLEIDQNQRIWAGTGNSGLNIFEPATDTFQNSSNNSRIKKLFENEKTIHAILKDRKNNIWIGTVKSLHIINSETLEQLFYRSGRIKSEKFKTNLPKESVKDIYQDNADIIWVATVSGAIDKYDPNQVKFSEYYISLSPTKRRDHITTITDDFEGNLLMSTFGDGLIQCTKAGKILRRFTRPILTSDSLNTVFAEGDGKIWVGGVGGLDIVNLISGKVEKTFTHKKNDKQSLKHNVIDKIIKTEKGDYWILTQEGINIIQNKSYRILREHFSDNIRIKKIIDIYEDRDKNIVIVGVGRAAIFNPETHKIKYLLPNVFQSYEIFCCKQDKNGIYWFGTDNGLLSLDTHTGELRELTTDDGLYSSWITDFEIIGQEIWMKTKASVSRLHLESGIIQNYTLQDGLKQNGRTIWYDTTSFLYVADEAGFSRFKPHEITSNTFLPPVYFTGFYLNGVKVRAGENSVLKKHIAYTDEIVLDYTYKTIRFTFSALNYTLPDKNQYKYTLQGYDTSWIHLENKNELTLMNIPPGNYVLKVKGSNNDKIWNPKEASVNFRILPPWWRTWQASSIFFLLFAGLIFFYRYLTVKNERAISEMNKLKEMNTMKLRLFTNITHEFRTPLSLILGPLQKVLKKNRLDDFDHFQISMVQKNARRMHRLVNQVMDLRKLDTDNIQLHFEKTNILDFVKEVIETFTFEAERKNIQTTIRSACSELIVSTDVSVTEKILSNLLSNAYKYTPENGKVTVEVDIISGQKSDQLVMSISDTGRGIPPKEIKNIFERFYRVPGLSGQSVEGTGIGLHLVKEMTHLLGGQISVKENNPHGTVFIISLPVETDVHCISDDEKYQIDMVFPQNKHMPEIHPNENTRKSKNKEGTILVIEDNYDLCMYISNLFADEGYNVISAFNGKEGLAMIQEHFPVVVISDIMMPEMDGIELCKILKAKTETSHIPVVLLTAKSLAEHQIEGYETGADCYVTKPFDDRILLAQVKNLISTREKLKLFFSSLSYSDIHTVPNVSKTDKKFLTDVEKVMAQNYANENFTIEKFAENMNISRIHLNRKFRNFIGISPVDYLRTYRLNKAAELLKSNDNNLSVAEVAFKTGFKHPSNFTRSFQKHFNMLPTDL